MVLLTICLTVGCSRFRIASPRRMREYERNAESEAAGTVDGGHSRLHSPDHFRRRRRPSPSETNGEVAVEEPTEILASDPRRSPIQSRTRCPPSKPLRRAGCRNRKLPMPSSPRTMFSEPLNRGRGPEPEPLPEPEPEPEPEPLDLELTAEPDEHRRAMTEAGACHGRRTKHRYPNLAARSIAAASLSASRRPP